MPQGLRKEGRLGQERRPQKCDMPRFQDRCVFDKGFCCQELLLALLLQRIYRPKPTMNVLGGYASLCVACAISGWTLSSAIRVDGRQSGEIDTARQCLHAAAPTLASSWQNAGRWKFILQCFCSRASPIRQTVSRDDWQMLICLSWDFSLKNRT